MAMRTPRRETEGSLLVMKHTWGNLLAVGIGGAVIVASLAGSAYVYNVTATRDTAAPVALGIQPVSVRVVEVQPKSIPISFNTRGFLRGFEEVTVHSEVDGQVARRCVDEGAVVRKDDRLVELDTTFRDLTVRQLTAAMKGAEDQQRQARAGLDVARAQVAEAEAAQQNALYEFERIERLRQGGNAVPTEVDRIATHKRQCEARMRMANAALAGASSKKDGADAALALAVAQLDEAKERQKRCVITSPIDGVVSMVAVDAGEFVRPTQPVCEVIRVDKFKLIVELDGSEAVLIQPGTKATVFPDARPDEAYEATVVRIGPSANPASKRFPVELHVANRRDHLMAGMFCRCLLPAGRRDGVLLVPRESVMERYGADYCYVAKADRDGLIARQVRVQTRHLPGRAGESQVVSGLEPGWQVITTGVEQLRDGQLIRLEQATNVAAGQEPPSGVTTP
jgi:multidrug efflux pump subunit AcrA (membrane-fusion protein)